MDIKLLDISRVADILPRAVEILNGPAGLQHYLGDGKDGIVYQMFDPSDPGGRTYDNLAIKIWKPEFRFRAREIELQSRAASVRSSWFRTPGVRYADLELGCVLMDRVPGTTAYRAIFRERRRLSESFLKDMQAALMNLTRLTGIVHNDAHSSNIMLSEVETEPTDRGPMIVDATIWIIDFGRSVEGTNADADLERVRDEFGNRAHLGV